MVDTTLHIVDPKNPGAVDEIINLGEYWDEKRLVAGKEHILTINRKIEKRFSIAYSHLAAAKAILDEIEGFVAESLDSIRVYQLLRQLTTEIFGSSAVDQEKPAPRHRHLFASAISPNGIVHYIESLLQDIQKLYVFQGLPGSGGTTLLKGLADAAHLRGLETEVYHCALEPHRIDLLLIPSLKTGALKRVDEIKFQPNAVPGLRTKVYDLNKFLNQSVLESYQDEINDARECFQKAFNNAISHISAAKRLHDRLESYYIPAMDFLAVEQKRKKVLARILNYLEQ